MILAPLLYMMLTVTPKECNARPEWCYCRQYVAMEENRCELRQEKLIDDKRLRQLAINRCMDAQVLGNKACDANDGDLYQPDVNVGGDE